MKLSVSMFCKNLLLNILIAAQICASAIFGVIAVAIIEDDYLYYNLTKDIGYTYAYMPEDGSAYYDSQSAVARYVQSGEIILSRAIFSNISGYDSSVSDVLSSFLQRKYTINGVYSLGTDISVAMKSQLKKGRWFSEEEQDGYIECVIIGDESEFPIGSVIDGMQLSTTVDTSGETVSVEWIREFTYQFKVVGTCGSSAEILTFKSYSIPADNLSVDQLYTSEGDSEGFFEQFSLTNQQRQKDLDNAYNSLITDSSSSTSTSEARPEVTILCSVQALHGSSLGDEEKDFTGRNALFAFADGVSAERQAEIITDLKYEAGVTDMATVIENAYTNAKNTANQYVPLLMCFIVMAVAGIVCVAVLNMIKNKRDFTVYAMCGMSIKRGALIIAAYTLLVIALSLAIGFAAFMFMSITDAVPWSSMTVNAAVKIFAVCDFAVSAVLIFASSIPMLIKYQFNGAE